MPCRFEIQIQKTAFRGAFHCAVKYGVQGWAWLWHHKPKWRDPCRNCPYYTEGMPTVVERELKAGQFWELSGQLIREQDWEKIDRIEFDDTIHRCGDCGAELDIVRPGKWQCPRCE